MPEDEEFSVEDPFAYQHQGNDLMFMALYNDFEAAIRAGFSHNEAFDLIRVLWEARVVATMNASIEEQGQ